MIISPPHTAQATYVAHYRTTLHEKATIMNTQHRYKVEKLVRDKLLERMEKLNSFVKTRILGKEAYLKSLEAKLAEESEEVIKASSHKERVSELADVLEVVHAFAHAIGASMQEVEALRIEKYTERGGFYKGLYCEYVDVEEGSELHNYYQEASDRYEEIKISDK
ncbi:MAG: hypothetical protein QG604_48 [Candidatus Dependentiae bacterium]|nr:hypothetical protein [Candidatus Dependentiae bacterium]